MSCTRGFPVSERTSRGGILCLLLLAGVLAPTYAQPGVSEAPPADLGALLSGFRGMTGLEARFEEQKYVALLAAPLTSRGRIYFAPPQVLLKRIEWPELDEVLVTPVQVLRRRRGREEIIDLRSRDEVRPLVESMLWLFAGNRPALESAYRTEYRVLAPGAGGRYRLVLTPKGAPLNQLIASMTIEGVGRSVASIEVRETSGDRTVTRIVEANPARTFTNDERQRLFGAARAR